MRKELQDFYNKTSGQDVYVIGGGPSVAYIDPIIFENKIVICINTSYKLIENPTCIYWCDESWVAKHFDVINSKKCFKFTAKHDADNYIKNNILATGGATVLKRTGDFGIDCNIDCVRGNNSGAHVINLLANMKVNKILLFGFDAKMVGTKSHWHEGYELPMSNYIYTDNFIPSICSMAAPLKLLKIKVENYCLDSKIECFTKSNWRDLCE